MKPFFSIIIPTYKKPDELLKSVFSVISQDYKNFEVVIVNDSPNDESYKIAEEKFLNGSSPLVHYVKNLKNEGVNYSRNKALSLLSVKSEWIIFLDDDDTLAPNTLSHFCELIEKNIQEKWFICNRAEKNGSSLTQIYPNNSSLDFNWNFLITKKFSGDATHCINTNITKGIFFPTKIKQGDEWMFFYQISLRTKFFYNDFNATFTDGYSTSGLNYRKRTTNEQLKTLGNILSEGWQRKILFRPSFVIYILIRLVRAFVKN